MPATNLNQDYWLTSISKRIPLHGAQMFAGSGGCGGRHGKWNDGSEDSLWGGGTHVNRISKSGSQQIFDGVFKKLTL